MENSGRAGQPFVSSLQLLIIFRVIRVRDDAIDRADFNTLRRIEMTDALRTKIRVNLVNLLALGNRFVRALRLAHVAIDALVSNHQRHDWLLVAICGF